MNVRKLLAPVLIVGALGLSACHANQDTNGTAANGTDMNVAGGFDSMNAGDTSAGSMADNGADMGNGATEMNSAGMNAAGNGDATTNAAATNGAGSTH
jgi:hypothetical protein